MKKKRNKENNYLLLGINPYSRANYFLTHLDARKKGLKKEDRDKLDQLWKRFKHAEYKLRTLKTTRLIALILLYSSIVSAISSTFLVSYVLGLETLTTTIVEISGIIGSTFFVIIVGITTKFIEMYLGDIYILTAKMIAIYTKYDR